MWQCREPSREEMSKKLPETGQGRNIINAGSCKEGERVRRELREAIYNPTRKKREK